MIPPALVKPRAMEGTGFLGQAADDVYRLDERGPLPRRHLRGAAGGVPHATRSSTAGRLPRRYAAFSPCYRKEAGSYGKDTRGIIRVHWFDKVEMFTYTTLEESYAEHQRLLGWEKEFLDKLELPTGSSTPRPATSACRPNASSTARPGSRRRASIASSRRPPTAPSSRPAGWRSAGASATR